MLSFEAPFRMESTSPRLSQKNCTFFRFNNLPQIEQLKMMGTSSLAIMVIGVHSGGQRNWNHWSPNRAPQPHVPEASVHRQ